MRFMRGDKVSMHIGRVLQRLDERRADAIKEVAHGECREICAARPKRSINYVLDRGTDTVLEVPLDRNGEVLLHTRNEANQRVSLSFTYTADGQLTSQGLVTREAEVLRHFESHLRPYRTRTGNPVHDLSASKQKDVFTAKNRTLAEIRAVQEWWGELESRAGCGGRVPANAVADFLVSKRIAIGRDKAKQLLGATKGGLIDFGVFRDLMYRGVLRNAIRYICGEVGKQGKEKKLPEFMRISNYKKRFLMKAFDPEDPQHGQMSRVLSALKPRPPKEDLSLAGTAVAKIRETERKPDVTKKATAIRKRRAASVLRTSKADSRAISEAYCNVPPLEDPIQIIQGYKKLVSMRPEYLVYNG